MEIFEFEPFKGIALLPKESKSIIKNEQATINCGRDRADYINKENDKIIIKFNEKIFEIDYDVLEKHVNRRSVLLIDKDYYEAEVRSTNNYYKLVPVNDTYYTTLEINGIHMHRIKGITPMEDAKRKVEVAAVRKGVRVLEIGTGLGYTAINSLKFGAREVITIEKDQNVLWLAERNPWSYELNSEKIKIILGNAFDIIKDFNNEFDIIIHDPPRFTSNSSELYSIEFYKYLYSALKRNGVLFHYTGEPGRVKGKGFPLKISGKLKDVGFEVLRYDSIAMGIKAIKK
ncbi:putative methyltransferase [Caldisphaera lagunensis DSM 15908]|uniref:Putative methyltransferase n=1 Tax=Caldisphaera lagunensis (strain DSM 15908 / JCM 11604 / ANMR 0165 / IC-154) TaxID=1056495 RepID=L0A923_CALLD|nr:methyltransferase [Caldisphaera lagunensis]AFZ70366.1 putative methyltransferase [Caldisphaera lagunensis DSM 15908]